MQQMQPSMSRIRPVLLATLLIPLLCSSLVSAGETRVWTSQSGATVEAVFVGEERGMVTLQTTEGEPLQIRRSILSPEDDAYLKRVLYKPKTITVSLEPNTALGYLVYTEAQPDPDRSRRPSIDPRRRHTTETEEPKYAQQPDTVRFRVQSRFDGEWMDDSTWNVVRAENLGQQLVGNANHADEIQKTDGTFLRVVFEVANNGKNEHNVTVPTVLDAKEREFTIIHQSRYFIPEGTTDPDLDKLAPGFTRTYCAIYEMPKDSTNCRLKVSTLNRYDYRGGGTYIPMGGRLIVLDVAAVK